MGPPILNDVATDLTAPPEFVTKPNLNPLPEDFKKAISEYYTDLKPLRVPKGRADTFDACTRAAKRMQRWTIEHEDAQAGIIEGVARTKLLRFKDDFVIRLSGSDIETVVDMRSKSRCVISHHLLLVAQYYVSTGRTKMLIATGPSEPAINILSL